MPMKSMFVLPMSSIAPPYILSLLTWAAVEEQVENDLGGQQRREEIDDDTKTQGYRKALNRAGAELEKNGCRDKGGDMGVHDGQERLVIAGVHRGLRCLPSLSSSRILSKMRTLESTDIPMRRTIAAIPGRVSVAPRAARAPMR